MTGSGHHVPASHQKQGGQLKEKVEEYLTQHGYLYSLGKDSEGHIGALLVHRWESS